MKWADLPTPNKSMYGVTAALPIANNGKCNKNDFMSDFMSRFGLAVSFVMS